MIKLKKKFIRAENASNSDAQKTMDASIENLDREIEEFLNSLPEDLSRGDRELKLQIFLMERGFELDKSDVN